MRYLIILCAIISGSILAVDTLSISNASHLPLTVYYTYGDVPRSLVIPGRDEQTSHHANAAIPIGYLHSIGRIQCKLGNNRFYEIGTARWPRSELPRDEHLVLHISGTDVPVMRWSLPHL